MAEPHGKSSQTTRPRSLKLFLCHAEEDKAEALDLYRKLRAEGFDPWLDKESLLPGQKWDDVIEEVVGGSDAFIACLSPRAVSEAGVRHREIKLALKAEEEQPEGSIFIIPLKLADCEIPRQLRGHHFVNYYEPDGYDKLLLALLERARKLGLPAPKTLTPPSQPKRDAQTFQTKPDAPPTPAPTVNALHQIPPPPRDFTGRREELAALMSNIDRGGVTISGLHGLGGIGKTALALKLAEQLLPRYPDAQFYLDLKGVSERPATAAEALAHVIRAYYPTAKLPEGEPELRAIYLSVLHNQRALLLMDNASGRDQVEPLIPPDTCLLLVTSRKHFHLQGLSPLSLDTLRPGDARDLLLKIAPRIADRADDIATLCGRLPLALQLAGGALAERINLTPEDYLRRLSDAKTRLGLVEASLTLSYDLLTPDLQKLWRTLAVFPATFDTRAAAAVWEMEHDAAQDSLGELLKFSMLEWEDATARHRLHDLARLFADSRLSGEERSVGQMRHAMYYMMILRECRKLYKQGGESVKNGLALFDMERPHIEAGQNWSREHASKSERAARLCNKYLDVGVNVLSLRQHPRERILWLEAGLAAARQLKDREAEGSHLNNLGLAYNALGEIHRAIEFYEQRLEIAREMGDRRGEGIVLGNLGVVYGHLGETRRAIEFYEQSLTINRNIGNRHGEGYNLGNMGTAYTKLGEIRRAIEFYEQQLSIAREIGDRLSEGDGLYNTSLALDKLGDRAQAIAHAEAAFEIYEQIESPYADKAREWLTKLRGQE